VLTRNKRHLLETTSDPSTSTIFDRVVIKEDREAGKGSIMYGRIHAVDNLMMHTIIRLDNRSAFHKFHPVWYPGSPAFESHVLLILASTQLWDPCKGQHSN
jgi:hypothetical protein